jgi:hypothetical protein
MTSMETRDSIAVAHRLRLTGYLLKLFWAGIAQCLMQAPAVMEALDILRDGIAGLGLILKLPMPDQLILRFPAWLVYGCAVE